MSSTLILMRHGQSTWNIAKRCQGATMYPGLTLEGLRQARRAALQLRDQHIDVIYSSDQLRAYQTAAVVGVDLGLPVKLDARLREMSQGYWQGMLYTDIHAQFGASYTQFMADPTRLTPPGGESLQALKDRTFAALDEIAASHPDQRLLIVTHEIPMATVAALARGRGLHELWQDAPGNAETFTVAWPLGSQQSAISYPQSA